MSDPTNPSPLAFATTEELLDELQNRTEACCAAYVLKGQTANGEDCTTVISGEFRDMAWLTMVLHSRVSRLLQEQADIENPKEEEEEESDGE